MAAMGPLGDSYALRCVSDLPPPFRPVFGFRYFNSLQSECFPVCFLSDVNMVVSAPTGSGKTVLFELCILRLLSRFLTTDWWFNLLKGTLKTIYIAPMKALVQEKMRDWKVKLGSLGINCLEMTGDSEFFNKKAIHDSDLILTTPEKFDSMSRHGVRDGGLGFFSDIALVLIDEVHLLNDPRGAALEAVVSRIKMLSRLGNMKSAPLANVRFIAVSATISNAEDIAEWLLAPPEGIKRFGEEMRPVKLTTKVLGYAPAKNDFLFERRLQSFIFDILMQHSRGKSALVFCSTRKGAQEAAQCLSQTAGSLGYSNPFMKSMQQYEHLREASLTCSDKQLQSCIVYGVGFHNGGLCLKDRSLVEGLFLKGDLQILCTTNTLAHGINLPAHTVVIKSTQFFNKEKGSYVEYDRSMVLQMCGRAGRPPFDDTGTVVIMTRRETVHLYENLLSGCEMVESQLLPCAVEHLNAEIVQLTVSDITLAIEWLKCSYLYIRIKKNPEHYGIKRGIPRDLLEKQMRDICVEKIHELGEYGLIWTDGDGFSLKPLGIQLRRNEKKTLNDINSDKEGRLRFHVVSENGKKKKRIQTREDKIFVLANDCLTGDPLMHDLSLNQETNSICSNGCRIAKCMKEYFIYKRSYRSAINSMLLAKCLDQKLWENSLFLLKQLPGIGIVTAKALKTAGVDSFESLATADARKLESATGRNYPFGNQIKESLSSLPPKIDVQIEDAGNRQGKSTITVTLSRQSQAVRSSKQNYVDMIVGSEEDNMILFHEKIRAREFSSPYSVKLLVPCPQSARVTLKVDLIFEEHVGIDIHKKHVVSREDDFHVTKAYGTEKQKPLISLPADICLVSSRTAETSPAQPHIGWSPLSKEVNVIEDDDGANVPDKVDNMPGTRTFNNLASLEVPSFDLMLEEDNGDMQDVSFPEPAKAECRSATSNTIFDHIRKKSRDFPTLMLSKSMDGSYEPLILKKMKTSRGQFNLDQGILHANEVTPMDSEHSELRVSPTNTAEKCWRILSRTSEKSRSLFAEKVYSPFEKSKSLNRIPDENSVQFADRRGSLSEKSKSLSRIPDENSVQFSVRTDSVSEKTKILWTAADENSHQFAGKRDSPSEKSKILMRPPDDSTLQFAGRRGSPSEKSNVLSRTLDENSLQFAAKRDSSSAKSNVLSKTPDVDSAQFAGGRDNPPEKNKLCSSNLFPDFQAMSQAPAAVQPLRIQDYCKDILASSKGSGTGEPFLGFKSVFSFL
ncbi:ATP-dependent DNA helicase MER3 homolog isoform X2 [Triticum aestivum]|uniref:ATP-dependent DNA helicase MER3 homolog isoform X2 n=1 Tax=Triticum aestivum TaxID=4565 RepID=UPI001D009D43|nr:ATP-dependent DNA helicase MER3 homolog isoform X2 [Triticum aestivum]